MINCRLLKLKSLKTLYFRPRRRNTPRLTCGRSQTQDIHRRVFHYSFPYGVKNEWLQVGQFGTKDYGSRTEITHIRPKDDTPKCNLSGSSPFGRKLHPSNPQSVFGRYLVDITPWEHLKSLDKSSDYTEVRPFKKPYSTMHKEICRDSAKLTLPEFDSPRLHQTSGIRTLKVRMPRFHVHQISTTVLILLVLKLSCFFAKMPVARGF